MMDTKNTGPAIKHRATGGQHPGHSSKEKQHLGLAGDSNSEASRANDEQHHRKCRTVRLSSILEGISHDFRSAHAPE